LEHTRNDVCKMEFANIDKRLEKLETNTNDLEVIRMQISQLTASVEKLIAKIDLILDKPSKRWELIVTSLITSGVTLLIGYFTIKR